MRRKICIFGDSITWGVLDDERGGWADRLKTHMFTHDRLADVYNLGISANTSTDVLARFETEAKARRCDTLIFAIGVNDSQWLTDENRHKVSIEEYEKNLRDIIARSQSFASSITFVGLARADESKTTPIAWRDNVHYKNEYILHYDEVLKRICDEYHLSYIPIFDLLENAHLPDGIHPSAEGHALIFERVLGVLK